MPLTFTVRAERGTPEMHSKGNFGTGTIDFVLDGVVIARFNNFSLRWSQQQQKYYVKAPARSVDEVNPQTGQVQKRWFDQWDFFPSDRQVHDGWVGAILTEIFRQIPDIATVPKQVAAPVQVAPAGSMVGSYGAPQGGPPMPGPQQQQQQYNHPPAPPVQHNPNQGYGPPAGYNQGQNAPPPPPGPGPQGPPAPPAGPPGPQAPHGGPPAPGAPPMPPPGVPAFAPGPRQAPPPGPSPTAHMPTNPSFPLPG